jgi:hypothetical protein
VGVSTSITAMGTSFFAGWRPELGNQLDNDVQPGLIPSA